VTCHVQQLRGPPDPAGEGTNPPLPCQQQNPQLWFSDKPADLELAKTHCAPCPMRDAVVAALARAGLVVIVRRALRAHPALGNARNPGRPRGRILRAPFVPGRLDVVRARGLPYAAGPDRTLDVYHRRDRPAGAPVLLHFHGGGFYSGTKSRETQPLIQHLTSRRGFVCVSADYQLQPQATLAGQVADVRDAIAGVRLMPPSSAPTPARCSRPAARPGRSQRRSGAVRSAGSSGRAVQGTSRRLSARPHLWSDPATSTRYRADQRSNYILSGPRGTMAA
jgi:hypothetical protein